MEVTCPQCRARQQLSPKEAALFWAVCAECGVIHGPATAKAGEGLSRTAGAAALRDQHEDAAEWVPAHDVFEDILTLGDEEGEGDSHFAGPWVPEGVPGSVVTFPAAPATPIDLPEPPAPPTFEAPGGADADDESYLLPIDEAEEVVHLSEDVIHLSEPPEAESEPTAEAPPAAEPAVAPPAPYRIPAPAPDGYAVGARVMRIAPVWVLLSGLGFLCVILLLSWVSKPASSLLADASPSASGGPKTEATNQSRVPATPALTASVNSAPKPAETAPAEGRGAKARAEGEAEAATAATPAQQTGAGGGGGSFTAQVGSYRDAANAEERVAALRAAGLEARAVEAEIPGRGTWHRVQCGRFATREEAARFGARLRAKGVVREIIITEVREQ